MDPTLLEYLRKANLARQKGFTIEQIDADLARKEVGSTYAQLVEMAKTQRDVPVTPVEKKDVALTAGQGATFNLLDEIVGSMQHAGTPVGSPIPVVPGERDTNLQQEIRERVRNYREQDPVGALATEIGGAVAVPGVGTAQLATKLGGKMGARILSTMGVGGGSGMIAGAGAGETLKERLALGGMGAAFGAGLGGMAGLGAEVARGARGLLGRALNKLNPERAGRKLAEKQLRDSAQQVGLTAEEFMRTFREANARRPGMVTPADVTSSFGRELRTNVNQASGRFEEAIADVAARAEDAGPRIAGDIRELTDLGPIQTARRQAEQRVRAIGKELFAPFNDISVNPAEFGDEFAELLKNPDVAAVWRRVRPLTDKKTPTVDHFRTLRTRLRGESEAADRAGNTALARHLDDARVELTGHLEDAVPGFRAANQGYYEANRTIEAFSTGADAYKKTLRGDRLTEPLDDLLKRAGDNKDEVLNAYRHGAVDEALNEVLNPNARGRDLGQKMKRLVEGGGVLADVFPDREALQEFVQRMLLERRFTLLRNLQVGNSTTIQQGQQLAQRLQTSQVQGFFGMLWKAISEPDPRVQNELANILTDLLLDTGDDAAERVARIITQPKYDNFFRTMMAGTAVGGGAVGTELQRTLGIPEGISEGIDKLKVLRDNTNVNINQLMQQGGGG